MAELTDILKSGDVDGILFDAGYVPASDDDAARKVDVDAKLNNDGTIKVFTDANKPTAATHGVGPLFLDNGRVLSSDATTYSQINKNDSLNEGRLQEVYRRIHDAAKGGALNYIITGDSTRATPAVGANGLYAEDYYIHQLTKLGVDVDFNAESGMSALTWENLSATKDLNACTGFISGTGFNSIVEFSLYLNDYDGIKTDAVVQAQIETALDALILAKPDIAIILASPVKTDNSNRNIFGIRLYKYLADKYNLPLIDIYSVMRSVHGDANFYDDGTHPGVHGINRIINTMTKAVAPDEYVDLMTLDEIPNSALVATTTVGSRWGTGSGALVADANWRCLEDIPVPRGAISLLISHQGNREDVVMMDGGSSFIETLQITTTIAPDRPVYLPDNCRSVRINLADNGATYDAISDIPAVSFNYMSLEDTNSGVYFKKQYEL